MLELCPTCTDTSAQTAAPLADRGVNDRLVELCPLVDETCFEFIDVSNFGAINYVRIAENSNGPEMSCILY